MASVSSLDKDLRNLRLGRYTPQAADEVRKWIEGTLGEPMAPGDLLDALKDGTVLCKYERLLVRRRGAHADELRPQTCQPCDRTARCSLQAIPNAVCPNGEHIPLSSSLPVSASGSSIPRHLPNSGFVRQERSRASLAVY